MSKRKGSAKSHDRIFKEFLHRFLPQFMALFFPDEAKRLDFASLTFMDKEMVINLPGQKLRVTDIIAEVRTKEGEPEVIIVHIEVEAGHKDSLPKRMFEYYSMLRLLRQKPVLPLALVLAPNAGGLRWNAYWENLFDRELLRFHYGQVGLRDLSTSEYLARRDTVAATLAVLMKPESKTTLAEALAQLKIEAMRTILDSDLTEEDILFLMSVVETYIPQSDLPTDLRGEVMEALPEVDLMWHEKVELKAKRKGLREGRREGRQAGRLEGQQEMLLNVFAKRFGLLPEEFVRRVRAIEDPALLERISEQLFAANTLDDIVLPDKAVNGSSYTD